MSAERNVLNAWRSLGRQDAFARRPSSVETARARHGDKAADAYRAGWRLGTKARGELDALRR